MSFIRQQSIQSAHAGRYSKLEIIAQQKQPRLQDHLWGGWRTTVLTGAVMTFIILIANFVILVWASVRRQGGNDNGAGAVTLYTGTCTEMGKVFTWSHLGVNVLSTILLSAGFVVGYRNTQHAEFKMDFWTETTALGIASNQLVTSPSLVSYNSVIFSTITANDYSAIMVANNFLNGGAWNISAFHAGNDSRIQYLQDNLASLVKLDNADCIKTYQKSLVSNYKDVLLVTSVSNYTNAVLGIIPQSVNGYSVEGGVCLGSFTCWYGSRENATDWTFVLFPGAGLQPLGTAFHQYVTVSVDYCLAEPSPPACTINLSRLFLGIVIICNIIKLTCIVSTLALKKHLPIVTIGDAIESFLVDPDFATRASPLSALEIRKERGGSQWLGVSARPWVPRRHFWFKAASVRRWIFTSLFCFAVWIAPLALLIEAVISSNGYLDIWLQGFGVLNLDSILRFSQTFGVALDVLIVNSPQVLLSFVYLLYNGLFTCMLLSAEYLRFATQHKSLRVTSPRGSQRSSYWLQLPYRYAVPLLVVMGILHWLVSQSIFLARIAVVDEKGDTDFSRDIGGCGWSPVALIAVLVLGALLIIALFGFGFRKFGGGMPIASSCSAAISAACHRADGEEDDITLVPLKYGVSERRSDGVLQVGFSAGEVRGLVEGEVYG